MNDSKPTNALADAASAYLRSAAHQPVQWREWSEATFTAARSEDKPILLDIGAVWCHWCHVMDRESYENEEIAHFINKHYIPIKVDRDERPDIDARYQVAVNALTGQGGWPLTAFLTPEGKPFYGGTYLPPEDMGGRPGMKRVLDAIAHNYRTHKADILSSAEQIAAALQTAENLAKKEGKADSSIFEAIVQDIAGMFDSKFGGFGNAPKFPHTSAIDLLLEAYLETRQTRLLNVVTATLEGMGKGGVYDQLGGGFHRYSVDERWRVPHFEKMSYDNAGLLINYLRAYQVTGNEFFREIAMGILTFVETVLTSPDGGFFASQDADVSLEDDGDYFTWTLDEIKAALTQQEAEVVAQYYHVEKVGEMHHNPAKNVLFIDQPCEVIAARLKLTRQEVVKLLTGARAKLLQARAQRPTPFVDTALYSSWNGVMISALLEAYKVLDLDAARERALQALDLLLAKAYDPAKGMAHSLPLNRTGTEASASSDARIANFDLLDDQVFTVAALLDAYEVTGRKHYFDRAESLMDATIRRFWDNAGAGFFDTAKDIDGRPGSLSFERKAFQDSPTPAANSVAAAVLDRLAALTGRADLRQKAEDVFDVFAPKATDFGLFAASYALALAYHLHPQTKIVVIGPAGDARTRELLQAAYHAPRAGKRVLAFDSETVKAKDLPAGLSATLPNLPIDDTPLALVCVGSTCRPPVRTPAALLQILESDPA
jgi:uncharacterized protein